MPREGLEVADIFRAQGTAWRKANAGHPSLGQHKAMSAIERTRPTLMIELDATHLPRAGDTLEGAWDTLLSWGYKPWLWLGLEDLEPIPGPRSGDAFWLPD